MFTSSKNAIDRGSVRVSEGLICDLVFIPLLVSLRGENGAAVRAGIRFEIDGKGESAAWWRQTNLALEKERSAICHSANKEVEVRSVRHFCQVRGPDTVVRRCSEK